MFESIETSLFAIPFWMYYNPVLTFVLMALSLFTFINFSGYCYIDQKMKELTTDVNDFIGSIRELSEQSKYDNNRISNLEQRVDRNDTAIVNNGERISSHYSQWSKMFEQTNAKITGNLELLEALNKHFQALEELVKRIDASNTNAHSRLNELFNEFKQNTAFISEQMKGLQEDKTRLKEQTKCLVDSVDLYWTATRTLEQKFAVFQSDCNINGFSKTVNDSLTKLEGKVETLSGKYNLLDTFVSNEVNAIKTKHKTLDTTVNEHFTNLHAEVDKSRIFVAQELAQIRNEQIKLRNDASHLSGQIGSIKSDIAANAGNFLNLSGEMNSLVVDLTTLKQSLTEHNRSWVEVADNYRVYKKNMTDNVIKLQESASKFTDQISELKQHAEESGKYKGSKFESLERGIEQLRNKVNELGKHLQNTDDVLQFTNSKVDTFISEERNTEPLSLNKLIGILQIADAKQDRQTVYVDSKGNTVDVEDVKRPTY